MIMCTIVIPFLRKSLSLSLARLKNAKGSIGKAYMAWKWGWSFVDSQQDTEALSLTAQKELNAASNDASWEADPSPAELQMRPLP